MIILSFIEKTLGIGKIDKKRTNKDIHDEGDSDYLEVEGKNYKIKKNFKKKEIKIKKRNYTK
jgi:hypothetical protein